MQVQYCPNHGCSSRGRNNADTLSALLAGLGALVSQDTVRRARIALDEQAGVEWMQKHLDASVWPRLNAPWIMDVDVSIKALYGKQEGAVVGYNPKKPGRPSWSFVFWKSAPPDGE